MPCLDLGGSREAAGVLSPRMRLNSCLRRRIASWLGPVVLPSLLTGVAAGAIWPRAAVKTINRSASTSTRPARTRMKLAIDHPPRSTPTLWSAVEPVKLSALGMNLGAGFARGAQGVISATPCAEPPLPRRGGRVRQSRPPRLAAAAPPVRPPRAVPWCVRAAPRSKPSKRLR
jgi:hypothetical protein